MTVHDFITKMRCSKWTIFKGLIDITDKTDIFIVKKEPLDVLFQGSIREYLDNPEKEYNNMSVISFELMCFVPGLTIEIKV